MTEEVPVSADRDAYLQWRRRIADKQAARRQPEEAPAPKRNSMWDPEALFRADQPGRPAPDQEASHERTIDLRDGADAPVTREPLVSPTPARPRHDAQPQRDLGPSGARSDVGARTVGPRDLRKERFDSVMARLGGPRTAQEAPTTGGVDARSGHPRPAAVEPTPIAESLRMLNQRRLEGDITDEEFNSRKAELFRPASGR